MSVYFTIILCAYLSPIVFLWLLFRPFLCRFDNIKLLFVNIVTVFTLKWSYHIINQNTRVYRDDAICIKMFEIPAEEYLKFGTQMILTTLWSTICSRCYHHWSKLQASNQVMFYFIRCSAILLLLWPTFWGFLNANGLPYAKTYYLGIILWTMMPIVGGLWYVAGNYITRAFTTMFISILIPSLYFCAFDHLAVYYRIWDVKSNTVIGLYANNLPIEQIIYYFIFNAVIVFTMAAFDKAKAVLNTFYPREQLKFSYFFNFKNNSLKNSQHLLKGLWTNETFLPSNFVQDLNSCVQICTVKLGKYSVLMNLIHSGTIF